MPVQECPVLLLTIAEIDETNNREISNHERVHPAHRDRDGQPAHDRLLISPGRLVRTYDSRYNPLRGFARGLQARLEVRAVGAREDHEYLRLPRYQWRRHRRTERALRVVPGSERRSRHADRRDLQSELPGIPAARELVLLRSGL